MEVQSFAEKLADIFVGVRWAPPHQPHYSSVSSTDLSLLEVDGKRRLRAFQRRSFETAEEFFFFLLSHKDQVDPGLATSYDLLHLPLYSCHYVVV